MCNRAETRKSDEMRRDIEVVTRPVRQITIHTGRPWSQFRGDFERAVPRFDRLQAIGVVQSGSGWDAIQRLSEATATNGFVNFFVFILAVNQRRRDRIPTQWRTKGFGALANHRLAWSGKHVYAKSNRRAGCGHDEGSLQFIGVPAGAESATSFALRRHGPHHLNE
jgi:hypothetical protein